MTKILIIEDDEEMREELKGRSCYKIPVTLSMRCSFADLVRFTEMIERKLPAFAIIQKLSITSNPVNLQVLSVNMDLNLYFISAN